MKPTADQIRQWNERSLEEIERYFKEFCSKVKKGLCPICDKALSSFARNSPCMHWLLKPHGFRKRYFPSVYEKFEQERIEMFLRWFVNAHTPLRNINDTRTGDKDMVISVTITYKELEWSFSCKKDCFLGKYGLHPSHYHFQMRINSNPFIDYGDYHIPLTDYDQWALNIKLGNNPEIEHREVYGMSTREAMEVLDGETLLENMKTTNDYEHATWHMQTMITAEPGKTISGDKIAELIRESKETGQPLAKLVKKLDGVKTSVLIEPGEGVPDQALRTQRNRGRKKKSSS